MSFAAWDEEGDTTIPGIRRRRVQRIEAVRGTPLTIRERMLLKPASVPVSCEIGILLAFIFVAVFFVTYVYRDEPPEKVGNLQSSRVRHAFPCGPACAKLAGQFLSLLFLFLLLSFLHTLQSGTHSPHSHSSSNALCAPSPPSLPRKHARAHPCTRTNASMTKHMHASIGLQGNSLASTAGSFFVELNCAKHPLLFHALSHLFC